MQNPRFLSVTLTPVDTTLSLLTLLQAQDSEFDNRYFQRCRRLSIQADFDSGGARFFIGNEDMDGTVFGVEFVATQSVLLEDDNDTIDLSQVWVRCNTDSQPIHLSIQFR